MKIAHGKRRASRRKTEMELDRLVALYRRAKQVVVCSGYGGEVGWQESLDFDRVTESVFLREAAWVVLSSGFRESVLRRYFGLLSGAFCEWQSARRIVVERAKCRRRAMAVFGSERKIDAILTIAEHVASLGIEQVKAEIRREGVESLRELPFMGPVTSYHLAKNLGLDVVKPDRHLVRMARVSGHKSPLEMCSRVARAVGDRLSVVDLVFWRYATLDAEYEGQFVQVR